MPDGIATGRRRILCKRAFESSPSAPIQAFGQAVGPELAVLVLPVVGLHHEVDEGHADDMGWLPGLVGRSSVLDGRSDRRHRHEVGLGTREAAAVQSAIGHAVTPVLVRGPRSHRWRSQVTCEPVYRLPTAL